MTGHALRLRSSGAEETRTIAAAAAPLLRPGDIVSLTGDLGAGKTCFVQGAARALGVQDRVTSPTFVLVKIYDEGRIPVVHCDVYRLDNVIEVRDLGDEVMAPDTLTFVEWGEAVAAVLPEDRLEVEILLHDEEEPSERMLVVRGHGSWELRMPDLADAWSDWVVDDDAAAATR